MMRGLLFRVLWGWLAAALLFLMVLAPVELPALVRALRQPNFAAEFTPPPLLLTAANWHGLLVGLATMAAGCALAAWWLRDSPSEARRWRREGQRLRTGLLRPWRQLRAHEQLLAGALAAAVVAVRVWIVRASPISTDELTSYDYYVWPGTVVTLTSYTLPNNHVFYNLLVDAWPGGAYWPADLRQRLPSLLVGLGLLPISYLLSLRQLPYRAATFVTAFFALSPTPAFYAVAGRGYGLQLAAVLAGFFAVLELLRPGGLRRVPWLIFVASGTLGLYTVPTHLYPLIGLGLVYGLGSAFPARTRGPQWRRLAVATLFIGAGTLLLYSPVLTAFGPAALLRNPYVVTLDWPTFRAGLLTSHLPEVATRLWGQGHLMLLILAILALGTPVALRPLPPAQRRFGWQAYALLYLPLGLMVAQRVYVPARALLPGVWCSFALLGVLSTRLNWPWLRRTTSATLLTAGLLLLLLTGYATYRFRREAGGMRRLDHWYATLRQQHGWLRAQRPAVVWVDSVSRPYQSIYWYHHGLTTRQPLPLAVVPGLPTRAATGRPAFAVYDRQHSSVAPPRPLLAWPPAYADSSVQIWQLPATPAVRQ